VKKTPTLHNQYSRNKKGDGMTTLQALLKELDGAAEKVFAAQMDHVDATIEALVAEERLEDFKAELAAASADKEKYPELTNDALRKGFVTAEMGSDLGEGYRVAYVKALREKMRTQAEYDRLRRREADLRILISALKPEE